MVDIGIPQVNFYSMLSGLGDTLQANRAAQMKRDAFAQATTPGPDGTVDYGKAILGLAQVDPQAAALLSNIQNHKDALAHQSVEDARNAKNDTFAHNYQTQSLGLQQQAAKRADYEFEHTPDQYVPNPKAGQPGEPAYNDQYAAAAAASANSKPIPFETLSGTKFLVRQPDGSYTKVDPNAVGSPQPQAAGPQVTAPPPTPQVAPPAAPPNFADRFAGGPAAAVPVGGSPATPAAPPQADLSAVDPNTGRRENWLQSQPPDVQAYIKKIADYDIDPRTTSIKGGHREQVMSAVAKYDPTYDQNTFSSRAKAIKDFATGQQGNSIRSFDVGISHLDILQKYITALNSGDYPAINSLRNAYLQQTGSSLPTNVQAVGPIVGAEVSKAIIGSNNALADREELRKPLLGNGAPDQILGSIQAYKELMGGQLRGLKKQYEDTTGKKNFNTRISDSTRNQLLGGGEGTAATSTSQPNVTSTGIKWSVQ